MSAGPVTLYGLKNCDTCKKAMKALDAADRETRRKAMAADPDWQEFLRLSAEKGYLVSQSNKLLVPVDFAPEPLTAD